MPKLIAHLDSFGAILPEATQDAAEMPEDALTGGMQVWATSDSPWAHLVDRARGLDEDCVALRPG